MRIKLMHPPMQKKLSLGRLRKCAKIPKLLGFAYCTDIAPRNNFKKLSETNEYQVPAYNGGSNTVRGGMGGVRQKDLNYSQPGGSWMPGHE